MERPTNNLRLGWNSWEFVSYCTYFMFITRFLVVFVYCFIGTLHFGGILFDFHPIARLLMGRNMRYIY